MLRIQNLIASIGGRQILNGLDLEIKAGEVHAIMGPNGAGKSTLSQVLAGREGYEVSGDVDFDGVNLLDLAPEERAAKGLFLAFQYPVEIPGVGNMYFLRTAVNAVRRERGEDEVDAVAEQRNLLTERDPGEPEPMGDDRLEQGFGARLEFRREQAGPPEPGNPSELAERDLPGMHRGVPRGQGLLRRKALREMPEHVRDRLEREVRRRRDQLVRAVQSGVVSPRDG